jgi:hypothetical protein
LLNLLKLPKLRPTEVTSSVPELPPTPTSHMLAIGPAGVVLGASYADRQIYFPTTIEQ